MTKRTPQPGISKPISLQWLLGMIIASIFSFAYILTPLYMFSSVYFVLFRYPTPTIAWSYSIPLILSLLSKPVASYQILKLLRPILSYFIYEEALEFSNEELIRAVYKDNKKFIFAAQPHGVISFGGFCSHVNAPIEIQRINVAVASSLLRTPILKNLMGIFGLVDASGKNFKAKLKKDGIDGCVAIYTGGIAELFKSSSREERLYLKKRKGFIKMALREKNVDIVPIYYFGNTSVFTVLKGGPLSTLSRRLGVALTYFWGKWYLPIPRNEKLLYARGKPIGLPFIAEPTDEEVNKWHEVYCESVVQLFDKYKEKVPAYKHKKLFID